MPMPQGQTSAAGRATPLLTLLSTALLVGCTGLLTGPSAAPPSTYLLAPALPATPATASTGHSKGPGLLVSLPESAAGYDGRRMAYLERDFRIDYFADHEWIDSPANLLRPLLVQALEGAGVLGAVSADGHGIQGELRLDTVIEALHQDFRVRPSQVLLKLRLRLVDPASGRILASQVLEEVEAAPADDPYGGVVALNRALSRLLPRTVAFVVTNVRRVK